jgi:hypothetical protein
VRKDYLQRSSAMCRHRDNFQFGRKAAKKTTKESVPKYNEEVGQLYIRYEKRHRKCMVRLTIFVSQEELKKGMEEDGVDLSQAEVDDMVD